MIRVENVSKTFVLHQQNGVRLPVLQNASLEVNNGECVVLHGHSGSGKSTLLRSLYANYLPDEGHIHVRHGDEWVDLVQAPARKVRDVRRTTIGWVSQFLRVIPRVPALEVVMQPLLDLGVPRETCAAKAADQNRGAILNPCNCILQGWNNFVDHVVTRPTSIVPPTCSFSDESPLSLPWHRRPSQLVPMYPLLS